MKPKYQSYSVLLIVAILFIGCAVGPRYHRPELDVPESYFYNEVRDSIINLNWWEIFNDETLRTLIDTALANNLDIKIAARRIEESAYVVGYNRADLFPSFGYDGAASRGNMGQTGLPLGETGNLFSGVGNVYWELDFWGKYRRSTEAAKAELLASEFSMRTIQLSIITNVASLYFQLQDFRGRLEVTNETLESRLKSLEIISARFEEGIVPDLDLNQAQIQEAIAAANVPFYEHQIAVTEQALSVLLGQNPGSISSDSINTNILHGSIPAGIPSDLLERRPDVAENEQRLRAQNARIGVAQAMRFPSISLTGALGAASSDLSNLLTSDAVVWSLAGNITGPIFNFGKNKRRVEIERARTEQAALMYEASVLRAFADVENALIGVDATRRGLDAYERQLTAARNAEHLSWERYNGGVTSYLEVLESQRQHFDSELLSLNAKKDYLNSYVLLYKALGGGWLNETEMEQATVQALADTSSQAEIVVPVD